MKKWLWLIMTTVIILSVSMAASAETYVENGGAIPDSNTYTGTWQQAYEKVLDRHAYQIMRYEDRTIGFYSEMSYVSSQCLPIALPDLTGDGIPELIFMEVSPDGNRGDFYLYSWENNGATCRLYVPGITRLDYDDLLGFRVFCSSNGGDTLVIKHYEYEWPWALQFARNAFNQYTLVNYFHEEYDPSGEKDDTYIWNGRKTTYAEYYSKWNAIEGAMTRLISDYFTENYRTYGFDYTWSDAMNKLQGNALSSGGQSYANTPKAKSDVYGYTVDKLSTRKGPSTTYEEGGTYSVKNQWIKVLAKAWDKRNSIWWVKCEIPYHDQIRVLWTGYKRFDPNTLDLDDLPEEVW